MESRVVVCAAIRLSNEDLSKSVIVCGPRHYDECMQSQFDILDKTIANELAFAEQGFVDNHGNFMNRHEALIVAAAANQLKTKCMPADRLFSEDLY